MWISKMRPLVTWLTYYASYFSFVFLSSQGKIHFQSSLVSGKPGFPRVHISSALLPCGFLLDLAEWKERNLANVLAGAMFLCG